MRSVLAIIGPAAVLAAAAPAAAEQPGPVEVVYPLNQGDEQATAAMWNIRDRLEADPVAKTVPSCVAEASRPQFNDGCPHCPRP